MIGSGGSSTQGYTLNAQELSRNMKLILQQSKSMQALIGEKTILHSTLQNIADSKSCEQLSRVQLTLSYQQCGSNCWKVRTSRKKSFKKSALILLRIRSVVALTHQYSKSFVQEAFFLMLTETGEKAQTEYREMLPNEYMGEPLPSRLTQAEEDGFKLACNTYMGSLFQVCFPFKCSNSRNFKIH